MVNAILHITDPENYFRHIVEIFREDLQGKSVIYITTNKPYSHLSGLLKKEGVDTERVFFIDCISRQVMSVVDEPSNVVCISSPQDITAVAISVSAAVDRLPGERVLFLDSLSTLLLYNDEKVIGQFSNFIINKMLVSGVASIIMALTSDIDKEVIRQIMAFVDEVRKHGD
jgi:KaiC/GvpD/RAD55 family RecA-like ATPase